MPGRVVYLRTSIGFWGIVVTISTLYYLFSQAGIGTGSMPQYVARILLVMMLLSIVNLIAAALVQ